MNSTLAGLANGKVLDLTTIGRKSGAPRTIEIWFVLYQGRIYLLAERGKQAGWVKNIIRNSTVTVRIEGFGFAGSARVLDPSGDGDLWRQVQDAARGKYGWGDGWPVEIAVEEVP